MRLPVCLVEEELIGQKESVGVCEEFREKRAGMFKLWQRNYRLGQYLSEAEERQYWTFRWQSADGPIDFMAIWHLVSRIWRRG